MSDMEFTLATSDGKQHAVDARMLEKSQFIQTMISDLGPKEMQTKVIRLQNIDGDTLNKILSWAAYHSDNFPLDDNTIHKRADEIENSLKNEMKEEVKRKKDIMNRRVREFEKEISDMKTAAGPSDWRNHREWSAIREKQDELLDLKKRNTDQKWKEELNVRCKALRMAHKEAEEKRNLIRNWERRFMDFEADLLFELIKAANFLEIPDLLNSSCNEAADMVKRESLKTLEGLPEEIQMQIAQNLCPHAFLRAADARIIPVSHPGQMVHAKIWASVFPNDAWFEAAIAAGANPVLIVRWIGKET
ncbi:hypothetical protein F5883DRAFT_650595 [Diaporthe sp. PMI_573]|nr:hypothetical protein F5883DRAFT_650595 [Diaporthaceae sp. PMI_573]